MPSRTLTEEEVTAIRRRFAEAGGRRGIVTALAHAFRLHRATIWRVVHGRVHTERDPHRTRRAIDKLTPALRAALLARYEAGEKGPALAAEYGITTGYVAQLWRQAGGGLGGRPRQQPPKPERTAKRCPSCRATRPLHDFYPDRRRPAGRTTWCIDCMAESGRAWRERVAMTLTRTEKWCGACERVRWADAFHRNRTARDGLQVWCADCHNAYRRERRAMRRAERRQATPARSTRR